jgi:hypothetical protein
MSCMTHECANPKCGHIIFNNSRGPKTCPKCDSMMIRSFDEDEHETPDNYDEELLNKIAEEE